jgi:predicted nucleic acid-binding protein
MFVDTTFCIDLMRERARGEQGPATRKLMTLGHLPLYMSLFVACELHAGARLSDSPDKEIRKVERLTELVEVVNPDHAFAVAYGEAEAAIRQRGKPVPLMDLLIGVMAKLYGMPLLAGTETHFNRIPGLVVETY